jgi:hypothetical protein
MGRTRDIAAILGKTEITNPQNNRILTIDDTSVVDSAYVTSIASAGALTYYSTLDSLPTSSLTAGDEAFVSANNRYYISNGSGWYSVEMIDSLG